MLGLYFAALLLAGPLHPLMHDGADPAAASRSESGDTTVVFSDTHATAYSPHSCPACFLNSHPGPGTHFSTAEINSEIREDEIPPADSGCNTRIAFSPVSNRAPPATL